MVVRASETYGLDERNVVGDAGDGDELNVASGCRACGCALALAGMLLASSSEAARASGGEYLYWTNLTYNTIERSNLGGTRVSPTFVRGADSPSSVAVNDGSIYWTDASGIGRANLDGSHVNDKFIVNPGKAEGRAAGVAVDSKYIYWSVPEANAIFRANIDGRHVDSTFLTVADGLMTPSALAIGGRYIYWAGSDSASTGVIGRATLNGKNVWATFITGGVGPGSIAVNSSYIYWGNGEGDGSDVGSNAIGRADLDGTHVDQSFIRADGPNGVAVSTQHVYWTSAEAKTVGRANLDGTDTNLSFLAVPENPGGIALSPNAVFGSTITPPVAQPVPIGTTPTTTKPPTTTATTTTTTTTSPSASTVVTVTAEASAPYTFTLSTPTQTVVSDTPAAGELTVPPGDITFKVTNPEDNINQHNFEICTTPLKAAVTSLAGVEKLPNSCTGETIPTPPALLAPGPATATLMVDLTTPGSYEYLSTANNPEGDAFSGMKGVLVVS
jgi:hypothetical protein